MLNELVMLERGLAGNGATAGSRHADIKDMAKGGVIRVRLKDDGVLSGIELIPPGGRGALWTLRDGQQNGFPGLKTAKALLQIDEPLRKAHEEAWRALKRAALKRSALLTLLAACHPNADVDDWPKAGHRRRIAERLEQLRPLADNPRTAAVPAVFERFARALERHPPVLVALAEALAKKVREGDETWLDPAEAAFTGPVALAMDVEEDRQRFWRDAGDSRQIEPASAALELAVAEGATEAAFDCAFTGRSARLVDGNFPQPNLPGLGQTYLFARNKDIPAMARYGRSGAASMPIDAVLSGRLSGSILALTDEQRKGKTWRLIPAEAGDKPDLFVASLPGDSDLPLADVIATEDGWSAIETASESVVSLFDRRVSSSDPQTEIRLVILRTVDPANRKAIFDRRTNLAAVHASACTWAAAMHNAPDWIEFRLTTKKGMADFHPFAQSPLSLIGLSRRLYTDNGSRVVEAIGVPATEAFALFMRDGDVRGRARRVLALLRQRHQTMIVALAQAKARGRDMLQTFDPKATLRRDALRSIAWMGALLHILDRPKGTYMEGAGFKLGQLLAAADVVHIGYCADLRGGQVPPTLLGNAVFATAGRHPVRALDILHTRWKPYGGWARRADQVLDKANKLKAKGGRDEQLGWQMHRAVSQARLAGEICAELKERLDELEQPDERFRAELLLGYVAGTRREDGKAKSSQPANSGENGDSP